MGKYKTKAIKWAYSRIFRHIQIYSGIIRHIQELFRHIQAYPEPSVILAYSEPPYIQKLSIIRTRSILRFLVYSEAWHIQNLRHIQNPGISKTRSMSRTLVFSEPCETSTMECLTKIVSSYNYFHNISFSRSLLL